MRSPLSAHFGGSALGAAAGAAAGRAPASAPASAERRGAAGAASARRRASAACLTPCSRSIGGDELLVVLRVGRHIGLRAGLLVVAVLQMALERSLALGVVLALQIVGHVLENLDVGLDALGLDRAARRRVIARRGQAQRAVLAERHDGLHGALAERARADQRRALVILQRAGDDLRGRGRAAVDQHDQRLAVGEVAAGPRVEALRVVGDCARASRRSRRVSTKALTTSIDWSSRPPGLLRRSRM